MTPLQNLILVLRVDLSGSDVLQQQGEGFGRRVSGGQVERGHPLLVFLQAAGAPGEEQLQETHVPLRTHERDKLC